MEPSLRLCVLGAPTLEHQGVSTALPLERRSQLVALLAVRRSWVGRAELATMLWPGQDARLAHANLRKTLFRLQGTPWADRIESQGGALRLPVATDALAFEAALAQRRLPDALASYRGELLAGFDDAASDAWTAWLGFERERLRTAWRGAALARLEGDIDPAEAIALSARLLEADPLDEAALRAQVTWLARAGQPMAARQACDAFVRRLREELGVAPAADLESLRATLGATPAAPSPSRAPPLVDDGFIGRAAELHEMATLLAQDDCRLLCIVGVGGIGKTRLARRAMQELAPGFADGAAFVALDDAASAGDIGARLAREIGAPAAGRGDPLAAAIDALRERQMLLVLDNFEQLAPDAARLQDLLDACSRVKVIVTSRVRLGIAGEWSLPVEGLACPDPEDADRIDAFDAARLFIKAARRVEPGFAPAASAAAIIDICRLVEGLPLALELAAAWVRVLPCEAIAAELRRGTELLHAADGARPARHAGIDVVFDQSWRHLGPTERKALAALSVFRDGFSAESARAVAGAPLPVLAALADRSLLRKEGARLHLHPLVQQLAAQRFDDEPARTAAHDGHADHFLALLGQWRDGVRRGDREALQRVDAEFENCRAAWRRSAERGHGAPLAGAASTLLDYCDHRGRLEDGLSMLRHALDGPAAAADPALHALLTSQLAHLQYRLDRYAEAQATASRALAASHLARQRAATAQSLVVLGACALRLGQLDDARRCFRQAQRLAASGTDPHRAAALLDNLALVEKAAGRYEEALRLSNASLLEYRRLGHAAGEALCLNNLGTQLVDQGEYAKGEAHLREALVLCERHGIATTRTLVLANFTELAVKTGDLDAAQRHAARALDAAQATGNRFVAAWLRQQLAHIALLHGDGQEARAQLAASLAGAQGFGRASLLLNGAICFARLLAAEGRRHAARQVLSFAIASPGIHPLQRDEGLALLDEWGGPAGDWPGWTLEELLQRIVAERDVGHAPLIAGLGGGA